MLNLMLLISIPRILAICGLGIALIFILVIVFLYFKNKKNNKK